MIFHRFKIHWTKLCELGLFVLSITKLCWRLNDELTFARAIQIAIVTEDPAKVAKETVHGPHPKQDINKIQPNQKGKSASPESQSFPATCIRCGKPEHSPKECRFKRTTCHYCSKMGHLKVACLKEKRDSNILRCERRKTQKIVTILKPTAIHLYHSAAILESLGNKGFVFVLSLPVQPRIEWEVRRAKSFVWTLSDMGLLTGFKFLNFIYRSSWKGNTR